MISVILSKDLIGSGSMKYRIGGGKSNREVIGRLSGLKAASFYEITGIIEPFRSLGSDNAKGLPAL